MRSKEFIKEASADVELAFKYERKYNIPATDALHAINIRKNCQPFLRDCSPVDNPFILYRGVNADEIFINKDVRLTERRPLNMNDLLHQKINAYMDDTYGHPYRNAMFCTGDVSASDYGEYTYYVFPQGNYDFLYSNNTYYDDLFMAWQKYAAGKPMSKTELMKQDDIVEKFLKNANYTSDSIINAAASGSEIMMWCNSYYGIRKDYQYWEELAEIITG